MKTQANKIKYILAAILVAALCAFSAIQITAAGTRGTASADVQTGELAAETSEADSEQQKIFSEYYYLSEDETSKVSEWKSGKDYDGFNYSIDVAVVLHEEESESYNTGFEYVFKDSNAEQAIIISGVAGTAGSYGIKIYAFNGTSSRQISSQTIAKLVFDRNYNILVRLTITETEVRFFLSVNDSVASDKTLSLSSGAVYGTFKSVFINGNTAFSYTGNKSSTTVREALTLYKSVSQSGEIEKEVIFDEKNILASWDAGGNVSKQKGQSESWLAGKEYDGFKYSVVCPVAFRVDFSNSNFLNRYEGWEVDSNNLICFDGHDTVGTFPNFGTESLFDTVTFETFPSNVIEQHIEITEEKCRLITVLTSGEEGTEHTFLSGTNEYTAIKSFFMSDELEVGTVFKNSSGDVFTEAEIFEELILYTYHHKGPEIPLPDAPEKEGHTFVGWFYDELFSRPYDGKPIYADTNLYAKFEINRYTVSFDTDGGKDMASKTVDWGTVLTLETPIKTGYDFLGWFLPDGTEYEGQEIKEDITLTAHWTVKILTVTFYVDGVVYSTKEVEYGTRFSDVIDEAKAENLELVAVLTNTSEKKIARYLNKPITDDYDVKAEKLKADPSAAQLFLKDYPWIFLVGGAGLSLIVIALSAAGYYADKQSIQQSMQ